MSNCPSLLFILNYSVTTVELIGDVCVTRTRLLSPDEARAFFISYSFAKIFPVSKDCVIP